LDRFLIDALRPARLGAVSKIIASWCADPTSASFTETSAPRLRQQALQLRVFRDDFGLARLRPDVARPLFVAGFVALRVELFADFVTAFRFGADFFAAAFAGARFFAGDVFAFVLRLVGWFLARLLRAAITAPDTAPINVPTTGVPTTVPTTAPATAPPSVLLAAPFSSLDKISFSSSSIMLTS
jgi:hypothetical protein